MSDRKSDIVPYSNNQPAERPAPTLPTIDTRFTPPARRNPGGLIMSHPIRWIANAQARSYEAMARRSAAEAALVEADTQLGHALIKNARMLHEYDELPQTLVVDRRCRQVQRLEEMRELEHQMEMGQARRNLELAESETQVTRARTNLTQARAELAVAQRTLLNAEQELEGQRQHGKRYNDLGWEHRIGERELVVEEQRAILSEHRQRGAQSRLTFAEDELLARRMELNADGRDTSTIDAVLERRSRGR